MDAFSYLSVLPSIVLGLAVTQVLQGFRGLVLARGRVTLYWPTLVWAVLLLVIYFQSWWVMFGLRTHTDWTFASFAVVLLQCLPLYMLAALVFPDFTGDAIDLRASYHEHRRWFFGMAIAVAVTSVLKDVVIDSRLPETTNLCFHVGFIAFAAAAAVTRSDLFHRVNAIVAAATFGTYVAVLFARLH